MVGTNPANLQITPVSRFDYAAGITLANFGHHARLCGRYRATGQLDSTNTTVQRLDDAQ